MARLLACPTRPFPHWARACLVLAATVALLAACSAAPAPEIPVVYTDTEDASILAGHWWGTYGSVESGRHGRVRFTLTTDNEVEAAGDVLMVPHRVVDSAAAAAEPVDATMPSTLRVRFVQLDDGAVVGALEPYNDPECGCLVSTTFIGELHGEALEGTYVSQGGPMHIGHSGQWRVERRAADESN